MAKRLLFDFKCNQCGCVFERLVQVDDKIATCPTCEADAVRLIPAPSVDYRMGVDPEAKSARKWERIHEQAHKQALKQES